MGTDWNSVRCHLALRFDSATFLNLFIHFCIFIGMNKFLKIILAIVISVFLVFLIKTIIEGPTPYSTVEFDSRNEILNYTTIEYVDTLSHIGLEYLGVSDLNITVLEARPHLIRNILPGEHVDGFVIQTDSLSYSIFINPNMNRRTMISILSHELIHVKQQSSGKLEVINNELAVFEGDTIKTQQVEYRERPWEREAYRQQREVERHIRSRVFN